ncbi:MAG TPA: capsule assembly Wzi family protein [Sediminibacterium sp.]|nr:capsule assembly Wzi family protein [Sediminibacterium sp.]
MKLLFSLCFLMSVCSVQSQTLVIGGLEDITARNNQLLHNADSLVSFTIRPLSQKRPPKNNRLHYALLPATLVQQYNTHHPYGWNDGSMMAAKGYQTQLSVGAWASLGPLEVQLRPELVYAANPPYQSNAYYGNTGTPTYTKLFPGQSSVRLSAGPLSVGLSTENLWWGPGMNSSLLMSNNAPGFLHGFLATRKPLKTPLGTIEFQLIGARLTNNNQYPYENRQLQLAGLNNDGRYLSAYAISWNPRWVPGLFLGMTRGMQRYWKDVQGSQNMSLLKKYVPVLANTFQKQNNQGDDTLNTDQLASFFLRWVLPQSKAEFYVEYGYNDYGQNIRDYMMSPTHSAAYLVGFKKIMLLPGDQYLDLGIEMTRMAQSPDYITREAGNWYEHGQVVQGYTHLNQMMGAGAGFGANLQTIKATWVSRVKQLGFQLERVERPRAINSIVDYPLGGVPKWTDLSIGIMPQWKYGNAIIGAKLQLINSANYMWEQNLNRFNIHTRFMISYYFNKKDGDKNTRF